MEDNGFQSSNYQNNAVKQIDMNSEGFEDLDYNCDQPFADINVS